MSNSNIIIKSIKGLHFALPSGENGYAHGSGLAFYDVEAKAFIAGNTVGGDSSKFPYVPMGGRKALMSILADAGEFFEKSFFVRPMGA